MEKTSVIRPDLTSPGAYLISSLCTMSWSSVTSGKWPSWSVSKCSRSWRHRSQNPRVRPCEPLCGLLRGGAASLPRRGILSRFRADLRGLPRLCGGQNRAPAEAQRSGFGGKRRSSGMIEFSPSSAETRDMKLAPTRSRRKALALFCANAVRGSPQCGLPRGFAAF